MVPSKKQCLQIMKRHRMLPHIVKHSLVVNKVALTLARLLNGNGCRLQTDLVQAGALLHDITKTQCLKSGENHALTSSLLLQELGFPRVARIVARHVHLDPQELCSPTLSEAEVVNYADKRVMHDRIVGLEERFQDIQRRYGSTPERVRRISHTREQALALERKIFSHLHLHPHQLERLIYEEN